MQSRKQWAEDSIGKFKFSSTSQRVLEHKFIMTAHLQRDNFWPDLHSTTKYDHSLLLLFSAIGGGGR